MKKILLLAVLFFGINLSAQISEVKNISWIKVGSVLEDKLEYNIVDSKNYYSWMYRNSEYKTITDFQSIGFFATQDELDSLYNIIVDLYNQPSKTEKKLMLGKNEIMLSKSSDNVYVFQYKDGLQVGWTFYKKRQIDKLFNKK